MLFKLLLAMQAIVAAVMIGLILMQKSEGGGLGVGGSPAGMLSARGAADFLTRATAICAVLFVGFSIALAGIASTTGTGSIDPNAVKAVAPAVPNAPAVPAGNVPLGGSVLDQKLPGAAPAPVQQGPAVNKDAAPKQDKQGVPLER
jgi:preprotein translocase subunit SecG